MNYKQNGHDNPNWKGGKTTFNCSICGKEFKRYACNVKRNKHGIYCSKSCRTKALTVDKDGYILVHKPEHPYCNSTGFVRLHRVVMEQHIGRILEPHEVVHHINEVKTDNSIMNLQLIEKRKHHSYHFSKYWRERRNESTRTHTTNT